MVTGFDIEKLTGLVRLHGRVARIVIASHAGSSPRETGVSMHVWADGQSDTIGGGTLEFRATEEARRMLATGGSAQVLKMPLGPALGQCCGGSVVLAIECFDEASLPRIDDFFARPVLPEAPKTMAVQRLLKGGRNRSLPLKTTLKDGWLIEPLAAQHQPLWIYGAGHVGRALVDAFADLPFAVTWIDTDRSRFPEDIRPDVTPLIAPDPALAVRHAPDNADHLILTYSHALDLELCHRVLCREFRTLGLIGSATKRARFRTKLQALGHSPAQISRIKCPIGDPVLGKEPKAIALGVAAELIRSAAQSSARKEAVE